MLSAEESFFQRSSRDLLGRLCPPTVPREWAYGPAAMPVGLWQQLAAGGWLGLPIPELEGGSGAPFISVGLFAYEAGRVLLPTVWRGTVLTAMAVLAGGTKIQRDRHLPGLADGSTVAALAIQPPVPELRLKTRSNRLTLSGGRILIPNAAIADLLMLFASDGDRGAVGVLVPRQTEGVSLIARPALGAEPVYEVQLDRVVVDPDFVIGFERDAVDREQIWEEWLDRALAVLCMEMAGGAARVLEMTAEYMLRRNQFGRALGSFQAVQHHLANMAILSDGAQATALQALWTVANRRFGRRETSIAKIWGGNAYRSITVLAHQLHAGIGYVRESDLHLWSERAAADALSLGTAEYHHARLWSAMSARRATAGD